MPRRLERFGGDAFALVDEAEQDVLGADVAVVQQPRFFLGEHHDPPGPVSEAFEHVSPFQEAANTCTHSIGGTFPRPDGCLSVTLHEHGGLPARTSNLLTVPAAPMSPLLALAGMDADRKRIEAAMRQSVVTADAYLTEIASHLIVAGGKRLRPALSVVVGRLNGRPTSDDVVGAGLPASSSTSARSITTT